MLVLAVEAGAGEFLSKVVGQGSCETLHDARVESLLDGATGLLDCGFLLVNRRLGNAILEDAVQIKCKRHAEIPTAAPRQ